jgi:hypothetical protein
MDIRELYGKMREGERSMVFSRSNQTSSLPRTAAAWRGVANWREFTNNSRRHRARRVLAKTLAPGVSAGVRGLILVLEKAIRSNCHWH